MLPLTVSFEVGEIAVTEIYEGAVAKGQPRFKVSRFEGRGNYVELGLFQTPDEAWEFAYENGHPRPAWLQN